MPALFAALLPPTLSKTSKNNKMKNLLLVLIALICFVELANAQKSKLVGSWLMTKAEVGGEVQNPYFITEFKEDGDFLVMGMDAGTWTFNEKSNSVVMKSELDKDFNGEGRIEKLTEKELVVEKDEVKLFYIKVDASRISENNKNSGLMGMWEFKNVPYPEATTIVTFTGPDKFTILQKEEGMSANLSGTWIFDKQSNSLIMIDLRSEDSFHGESKIVKFDAENLELENNGTLFKGIKKAQNTIQIERLSITEGDFYNEDGDYKYYGDEEKLPWWDWAEIKSNLLNVNQLIYNYSTLISGTEAFETKTLIADIKATPEEEGFVIDNIFSGYDRYTLPVDAELPENYEYSKALYPITDDIFRVVGSEQITTPAGTFSCTVVEVASDSDVMKKLWVITDKPGFGIYAKIIEDNPDETWGHYSVYELVEIK
ncbi:MAG: hypothetical protein JW870_14270 [Candidatus Delongbacteria bacterium]|nr:hypothetical protein [Candidatus Delongbacteria bacterium]